MGSNLPPGCSVSDIPGNRPEELAEEARWDVIYRDFPWMVKLTEGPAWAIKLHDAIAHLCDYVYQTGIAEGERRAGDALADKEAAEALEAYEQER